MRDRPIDAAILRRLIAEGQVDEPPAEDALASLAELLNAAVPEAPGASPGECPKEEAAVAAFRAAHGPPASTARTPRAAGAAGPAAAPGSGWWRPGRQRTALFGAVVATLLGGGAAFAAGAGPFSFGTEQDERGADRHSAAPRTPSPAPGAPQSAAPSGERGSPAPDGARSGKPGGPGDVEALCRDYWKKPGHKRDEALAKARFAPLVDAAGSAGDVGSYCDSRPGAEGSEPGPNPNANANSGDNGTANGNSSGNANRSGANGGNGSATSGSNGNGNASGNNGNANGNANGTGNASAGNGNGNGNNGNNGKANGNNGNANGAPAAR